VIRWQSSCFLLEISFANRWGVCECCDKERELRLKDGASHLAQGVQNFQIGRFIRADGE
jgi:hypothetical protein